MWLASKIRHRRQPVMHVMTRASAQSSEVTKSRNSLALMAKYSATCKNEFLCIDTSSFTLFLPLLKFCLITSAACMVVCKFKC